MNDTDPYSAPKADLTQAPHDSTPARKPFFDYFFGAAFVLLGLFALTLTWAFSTMVAPELQGAEWWSAVTGSLGFRSGIIVSLGTLIGGVRLLIRYPKP